jgi:hypothetical protein
LTQVYIHIYIELGVLLQKLFNNLIPTIVLKLMAQKSLPILNKVGTSMVWYTTFFYKYHKWLSAQYLYMLYFFNKLFVYIDFLFSKLQWVKFYLTELYLVKKFKVRSYLRRHRFYKPLTSYLINIGLNFSLINIYYKTSLETFQELDKSSKKDNSVVINTKLLSGKFSTLFFF